MKNNIDVKYLVIAGISVLLLIVYLTFDVEGGAQRNGELFSGTREHLHFDFLWHLPFEISDMAIITLIFVSVHFFYQSLIVKNKQSMIEEELNSAHIKVTMVIDKELSHWGLTNSEKDVAWKMIQGNSVDNIANIRSVSVKTVNNQISKIFVKANVRNKPEFLSLFLDDIYQ